MAPKYGAEDTVRECHNQKNCQEVQQSKAFPGCVTIISSTRECRNHGLQGTARQYHKKCNQGVLQLKTHQGSVAIKKYCQEVSQLKYLRKCYNRNYYQGPPQSKVLPWTTTVKNNARKCRNKTYPRSATYRSITRGMTTRKCDMQIYVLQVRVTIKKHFKGVSQSKNCQNNETIKSTSKEYHNLNICKGVIKSKWSATIKTTTRVCHNQSV